MADQIPANPKRPKAVGYRVLGTGLDGQTRYFITLGILPKDQILSRLDQKGAVLKNFSHYTSLRAKQNNHLFIIMRLLRRLRLLAMM
jgi:hypothetical protein